MKRSISPATTTLPCQKRVKRERGGDSHIDGNQFQEDDVAALLLSLGSQKQGLSGSLSMGKRMKQGLHEEEEEATKGEKRQVVVSDDEEDEDVHHKAPKRTVVRKRVLPAGIVSPDTKSWACFSKPLGPPPRLPTVPAGYVFPPAQRQNALKLA